MKKVIMPLICLTLLTTWIFSEKFNSFVISNNFVCLPFEQMDKLVVAYKLVPEYENKIKLLQEQTNMYNIYTTGLERHIQNNLSIDKKKKIKLFINGIAVGVGITTISLGIIIIKIML